MGQIVLEHEEAYLRYAKPIWLQLFVCVRGMSIGGTYSSCHVKSPCEDRRLGYDALTLDDVSVLFFFFFFFFAGYVLEVTTT